MADTTVATGGHDTTQLKSAYEIYKNRNKCLLHNWEEERRVVELKEKELLPDDPMELQYGHPGILTLNEKADLSKITDFTDSFQYPTVKYTRQLGLRRELKERQLVDNIQRQMFEKMAEGPEKPNYQTTTMEAFNIEGFESKPPQTTTTHDYRLDQPLTYWSENYRKIHGVSMVTAKDTVFRRNDHFSKPISDSWGEAQPYELEKDPLM